MKFENNMRFLLAANYENLFEVESTAPGQVIDFICKGCRVGVKRWDRLDHYENHKREIAMILEANRVAANLNQSGTGDSRMDICTSCGEAFEQERKRGRPRKKCFKCLPPKE